MTLTQKLPEKTFKPATLIGASARAMMMTEWAGGRVEAALTKAAYIWGSDGEVLWLSPPGSQPHWRSVIVPFDLNAVQKGMKVTFDARYLNIGEALAVQISGVPVWESQMSTPEHTLPPDAIREAALRVFRRVAPEAPSDGLGQLITVLVSDSTSDEHRSLEYSSSLVSASRPVVAAAAQLWRSDTAFSDMLCAARGLIGLGPGLTPSGDDFVGGLLFAVRSMDSGAPELSLWHEADVVDLLALARKRTNLISYALLTDYAHGRGPGPLHDLAQCLITGQDEAAALDAMRELVQIGHTSGWDILAGFCTGILAASGINNWS